MNTLLTTSVVPKSEFKTNLRLNHRVSLVIYKRGRFRFALRMKASTSPAGFAGTRTRTLSSPYLYAPFGRPAPVRRPPRFTGRIVCMLEP